jgi:hypothetical protein
LAQNITGQKQKPRFCRGHALDAAAQAGRFDVVAQLAKELEARRLGRDTTVVSIDRAAKHGH